jgi:hypothetical protein
LKKIKLLTKKWVKPNFSNIELKPRGGGGDFESSKEESKVELTSLERVKLRERTSEEARWTH